MYQAEDIITDLTVNTLYAQYSASKKLLAGEINRVDGYGEYAPERFRLLTVACRSRAL